jgi:hypothetical protein
MQDYALNSVEIADCGANFNYAKLVQQHIKVLHVADLMKNFSKPWDFHIDKPLTAILFEKQHLSRKPYFCPSCSRCPRMSERSFCLTRENSGWVAATFQNAKVLFSLSRAMPDPSGRSQAWKAQLMQGIFASSGVGNSQPSRDIRLRRRGRSPPRLILSQIFAINCSVNNISASDVKYLLRCNQP